MSDRITSPDATPAAPPTPPPPGAPWDLPFEACTFALLDCEMTGLDPAVDRLLEVAVARVRGGVILDRWSSLVQCDTPSCAEAQRLHGIAPSESADAPTFAVIAPTLAQLLDGAVPVMHGAELDVAFLDAAFARLGMEARVGPHLDTVLLARRILRADSYALGALSIQLGTAPRRWHRAAEDVEALLGLFAQVVDSLGPRTARDLWQVRAGERGPVVVRDTIAAALAARVGQRVKLLVRPRGRDPVTVLGRLERWTPPHLLVHVKGPSGGLRLLRADRVLQVLDP
jgi:DNA polymerase-3 subunit epsilon